MSTLTEVVTDWTANTVVPLNLDFMYIIVYFTALAYMKVVQREQPYFMPEVILLPTEQLLIPDINTYRRPCPGYEMNVFKDFTELVRALMH